MPWVRLDEQFPDHPKVQVVGPLASWLHVCGLAYCNRLLTDGFIPTNKVGTLADFSEVWDNPDGAADFGVDPYRLADKLCEARMWKKVTGGYLIHDYTDYQPTRANVMAERKAKQDAGRKGGMASAARRGEQNGTTSEADGQADAEAGAQAGACDVLPTDRQAESKPDPTRPGSDLELQTRAHKSANALALVPFLPSPTAPAARGRTIPDDFSVTAEMRTWAARETPNVNVSTETAKFCDYWASEAGQRARKRNWTKAWQVWMRKAEERAPRARPASSTIASRSEDAMLSWLAAGEGA